MATDLGTDGIGMGISRQQSLFDMFDPLANPVSDGALAAVQAMSTASDASSRGAVFTRQEIADRILDLVEYTPDRPIHLHRILEPSFGQGCFLFPIVERLLTAWETHGDKTTPIDDGLGDCIRAVEIHANSHSDVAARLLELLKSRGVPGRRASNLVRSWLVAGDFLLVPLEGKFTHVVGNPPYLRAESIPAPLMTEYRRRYRTIFDRADIYVPFIERGLDLLADDGRLGFICSDRWLKNRYGGPLRRLVSESFHLTHYIDMVGANAFDNDVSAYTGIFVIARNAPGPTLVSKCGAPTASPSIRLNGQGAGDAPLLLADDGPSKLVRNIEQRFPIVEQAGCRIGIGVATGADAAFIHEFKSLDVEADRKLPLVTRDDLIDGVVRWGGLGVINPFRDDGGLVDLDDYPRLRAFLQARREKIAGRHCAKKSPAKWFRTIDRIWPELAAKPKLLIPDISETCHVAFEGGGLYPHHNLYFVLSDEWDLRALQAILLSGISHMFLNTYSLKMRGGYFRCQAQYLRRIRIPSWEQVPQALRTRLRKAAESADFDACNRAAFDAYGLSNDERDVIIGMMGARHGRKG